MSKTADLCTQKCKGLCCTGLSIPVDKPKNKKEVDELRFYIVHKNIKIYIRSNRWYVLVDEKCENLGRNNLCKEYETRPMICRDHSHDECEYWGDFFDTLFNTDAELLDYLEKKKIKKKSLAKKKAKKKVTKKTSKKAAKG